MTRGKPKGDGGTWSFTLTKIRKDLICSTWFTFKFYDGGRIGSRGIGWYECVCPVQMLHLAGNFNANCDGEDNGKIWLDDTGRVDDEDWQLRIRVRNSIVRYGALPDKHTCGWICKSWKYKIDRMMEQHNLSWKKIICTYALKFDRKIIICIGQL
jgi:hypothetical protein